MPLVTSKKEARAEWEEHRILDETTMSEVTHTSHVETALRIVADNCIRAGIVYDKSRLNKTRYHVTWFSPNVWRRGFRYGNIAFCTDFKPIQRTFKFAYWIENASYDIPAPRFLLSTQEDLPLVLYNPAEDEGPWVWSKSNGYRREDNVTLEFLIRSDLPLKLIKEIRFVKHHTTFCSNWKRLDGECPNLGWSAEKGGAYFMAGLVANGQSLNGMPVEGPSTFWAWNHLRAMLSNLEVRPSSRSTANTAYARAILHALYRRRKSEANDLSRLFRSREELIDTVRSLVQPEFSHVPDVDDDN